VPSEAFSFKKSLRLLNARDYSAVFDNALIKSSHQHLLVLSRPNLLDHPRLGLVIAKKNIRFAVQRNRIKRILRESFRLNQESLIGLDIVILARRGLDQNDNQQIHALIVKQWARLCKKKIQLEQDSDN
jgi:ribonuclease P protein component